LGKKKGNLATGVFGGGARSSCIARSWGAFPEHTKERITYHHRKGEPEKRIHQTLHLDKKQPSSEARVLASSQEKKNIRENPSVSLQRRHRGPGEAPTYHQMQPKRLYGIPLREIRKEITRGFKSGVTPRTGSATGVGRQVSSRYDYKGGGCFRDDDTDPKRGENGGKNRLFRSGIRTNRVQGIARQYLVRGSGGRIPLGLERGWVWSWFLMQRNASLLSGNEQQREGPPYHTP